MTTAQQTIAPPDVSTVGRRRLVGAAAIATAVLVVAENVVLAATGAPTYGAPTTEVLAYYAANRTAVAVASGLVALYLPLLLVFAGVIGGLFAFGLIGLFVGPVVLAVTYTLLVEWVGQGQGQTQTQAQVQAQTEEQPAFGAAGGDGS